MKKKICAFVTGLAMLCAMPTAVVHAAPELDEPVTEIMTEEYIYADDAYSLLWFTGSTANCYSKVNGISGVYKIEGKQRLQKKVLFWWEDVATWESTVYGDVLVMNNPEDVTSSGTYRVRLEATVYYGSVTESIKENSENIHY